ncbi:hypothetical protein [Methyloglobulus sp.]|uniref:hypothetical protein n=1 Tax=Methyloglobulus sp. TaxID=2518622 RepID=UPI0032B7C197
MPGLGNIALGCQLPVETGEQSFNQAQGLKLIPKQPDGFGIRDAAFQLQSQKAHETEAVADLVFDAIIR